MAQRAHAKRQPRVTVEHEPAPSTAARALRVGAVDDPAERNADALARAALQLSGEYAAPIAAGGIHRRADAAAGGELRLDAHALDAATGSGTRLDDATLEQMEGGFGRDLGDVRVHTGAAAGDLAGRIGARAFTHGQDIYFAPGEYQPGSPDGRRVLAHELAHTAQHDAAVRRYPATAMSAPVPWASTTASVFRPGGGVSGGVYIMTTNVPGDPVQKAVAKPIFGTNGLFMRESGEQLTVSDRVLGDILGLSTPASRIVKSGTKEFDDLVKVCAPYQPAKKVVANPDEADPVDGLWKPLAQAESFIVMSEIPDATSIGGLAEKAGTDKEKGNQLWRTVFNPTFLADLGTLCIGDLLLGNPDRMVLGAMNLGNVMLSVQDGTGRLVAADSTAYLPKFTDPEQIAKGGTLQGNIRSNAGKMLDDGPGQKLDDFFEVVVSQVKNGTPPVKDGDAPPIWQVIEDSYKNNRQRYLSEFEFGWNGALITILGLDSREGDRQIDKAFSDDTGSEKQLSKEGLKTNAAYIGARAWGGDHADSVGRAAALNMAEWARGFDRAPLGPSQTDELAPGVFATPDKKVLAAEWSPLKLLPTTKDLNSTLPGSQYGLGEAPKRRLAQYPSLLGFAHAEVDQVVSPTKERRKNLFSSKSEQLPRMRNQLGHSVVNAYGVVAGAGRVLHGIGVAFGAAQQIADNHGIAKFKSSELTPVESLATYVAVAANSLESVASLYEQQLPKVSAALPKATGYPDHKNVANAATVAAERLKKARSTAIGAIRKHNLQRIAANLSARA